MKNTIKTLILLFLIVLTVGCSSNDTEKDSVNNSNKNETEESNNSNSSETTRELTESEKMLIKVVDLIDEGLAFDTGSYIKGEVPAGEYAFVKFEGSGSYYEEEDSAGNIIDNENFDSFGYVKVHASGNLETYGVLVNVSALNKLGVKGAKELYEILNDQKDWNQAGLYKVGTDIAAGKYVVDSLGSGYYAILSGPVGNNKIIDNDIFNGKKTINIKNGQYLQLSKATITKSN